MNAIAPDTPSEDTTNNQYHGYGLKSSFKIAYKVDVVDLFFEPYIDFWNIDDSESTYCLVLGNYIWGKGRQNKSTIYGINSE